MRSSSLLRSGALAGGVAGLLAALVQWLHTEPVIRRALAVEEARGSHEDHEVVSRTAQVIVGAATAVVVGVLFGLVFAVVFARLRHRLPGATDQARSLWLGAFGFAAVTLMPALAIPANPPAVGDHDTVTRRTLIYVLALLAGLLVACAVSGLDALLRTREVPAAQRVSADLVAVVVLAALALWLVPDNPDRIPADVPAGLLWDFRVASLAQLGTMWLVLAVGFGLLVSRRTPATRGAESVPAR